MSPVLPKPIALYFDAKNSRDVEGMLACFDEGGVVRDEGKVHEGRTAIKAWMEDTTARYSVTASPERQEQLGEWVLVGASVSGNFPGSPAQLTYKFRLSETGILNMEIG